jgi:hypothetical protein
LDRETGAIFAAPAHAYQPFLANAARHSCVSLSYRLGFQALRMLLYLFEREAAVRLIRAG